QWKVPHFEKMLYDNAQLVSLYSQAHQLTGDSLYRSIVYETLAFIEREMTSPEGAFFSSLDADSEGEEGKFYVWDQAEIEQVLGEGAPQFVEYFNMSKKGNWEEGKNILYPGQRLTNATDQSTVELSQTMQQAKERLLAYREQRTRPGLDDKVLTAWNAQMLNGYVNAYRAFGEERFLQTALTNADFLKEKIMQADFSLTRSYKDGVASIDGFLDDYAFTIAAFINLYQATFDESWLYTAQSLTNYVLKHFSDEEGPLFFYTSNQHASLIARQKEISDNVIPSSNSIMAKNFWTLGLLLANDQYTNQAKTMLATMYSTVQEYPNFHANWASLLGQVIHEPYEVAILGESPQVTR
ncbi:MAG: thioredoxin domain-containing protein, partial [Bacteroidota bacterium]